MAASARPPIRNDPSSSNSKWFFEQSVNTFDVPVPGWPTEESSALRERNSTSNGDGDGDGEIDEALAEELRLPARRLRGLHSRASPRASKACEGCRKRKARCDNRKPKCGGCIRLNIDCQMPAKDLRKTPSNKKQVAQLERRLAELERKHGGDGTGPSPSDSGSVDGPSSTKLSNQSVSPQSAILALTTLSGTQGREELDQQETDLEATAALVARDLRSSNTDGTFTPAGPSKSLAAQITGVSGRMSVADGGQLRWYGPTSNRHFSFGGPLAQASPEQDVEQRCLEALAEAGQNDSPNPALEKRLLSLYFIWHNSFFYIVNQEIFMVHRQRYLEGKPQHKFFSWTLYYAILAYSASFSDEAIALADGSPERSGDLFMRRARICLEVEMDCPRETTVQALAIMGSHEVCCGRDARGYLYHSMAVSSAVDLGLHKDSSPWLEKGKLTMEDYRTRNLIWWGTYIYDRGWSVYVGRLPNGNRDISCPHPYASGESALSFSGTLVSLLKTIDRIMQEFYSGDPFQRLSQETAAELHQNLLEWHNSLPLSETLDLDLQPSPLANVIVLHVQYYATMLLLHRPFLADSASNAFAVCCSASSSMANLLKLYKRLYSFRRMSSVGVHQIFTAATTLVYIFHKSEEQQAAGIPLSDPNLLETTRSSLLTCLAALSALATRQVHARRSYLSVILLMKKWRVSLEVLETQKRPTATFLDATMPQSQQFEALSHELFEMSNSSLSTFMGVPDFLTLPANNAQQPQNTGGNAQQPLYDAGFGDLNQTLGLSAPTAATLSNLGTATANSGYASYQDPNPLMNSSNVFDFFNVDSMQIGDQSNLQEWAWEGPSLFDMFDIVNPAGNGQSGQGQNGQSSSHT